MRRCGSGANPAVRASARSTDSNALAARTSASATTRRTRAEPGPRTAASRCSAGSSTRPLRNAESVTASPTSYADVRRQSTSVRSGLVTIPACTSHDRRSTKWTPARSPRTRRCLGTVTWGRSGIAFCPHPHHAAAEPCERTPDSACARRGASPTEGSARRPRATRTIDPASSARRTRSRDVSATRSVVAATPPSSRRHSETSTRAVLARINQSASRHPQGCARVRVWLRPAG